MLRALTTHVNNRHSRLAKNNNNQKKNATT
jgi:hypothetical protein